MGTECHHPHSVKERQITIHSSRNIKLKISQFTSFHFTCKLQGTKNGRCWQVNCSHSSGPTALSWGGGITEQEKGIREGQPAPWSWVHQHPLSVELQWQLIQDVLNICWFNASFLNSLLRRNWHFFYSFIIFFPLYFLKIRYKRNICFRHIGSELRQGKKELS